MRQCYLLNLIHCNNKTKNCLFGRQVEKAHFNQFIFEALGTDPAVLNQFASHVVQLAGESISLNESLVGSNGPKANLNLKYILAQPPLVHMVDGISVGHTGWHAKQLLNCKI